MAIFESYSHQTYSLMSSKQHRPVTKLILYGFNSYYTPSPQLLLAYVMALFWLCVLPSVCPVTCILNIFSETTYPILKKFHRNVPTLVLFRLLLKNLIPSKTLVAMATKLKNFSKSMKIFLSETIRLRATKFGM